MLPKKGYIYLLITLLITPLNNTLSQSVYWTRTSGLDSAKVYSISFNQIGQPVVGTANQGSLISTDGGNSWTKACDYPFFCVKKDGSLKAGTEGHGIVSSRDSGRTWVQTSDSLGNVYSFFDFLYDDEESGNGPYSFVGSDSNIAPWPTFSIAGYSKGEGYVDFFAGTYGGGVYHAQAGSWVPANDGLTDLYVHSVAINYSLDLVFAATDNGVFRSTNLGAHWSKLITQWTSKAYCLVLNRRNWLFAGTGTGVFCSRDQGESWLETSSGLTNRDVSALAVAPDGHVWVGTWGGGVFRSIENTDRPPRISSFEPLSAPPGSELTIRGENFLGASASNYVYVGGERAEIQSMSENVIKVLVPYGSAYGYILVVSSGLSSASTLKFTPTTPLICVLDSLSFSPPAEEFAPATGYVTAFDVDGDQRPDLLVGRGSLLLNKSTTGTFDFSSSGARLCVYGPPGVVGVCDVDADGRLDLFMHESAPPMYSHLHLNRTVNNIVQFRSRTRLFSKLSVVGLTDIDLDGRPDMLIYSSIPAIQVIENRFDGFLFRNSRSLTLGSQKQYSDVHPVDLNGDQYPEIIAVEEESNLVIFKNESGPGTYAFWTIARYPIQGASPKLAMGDIDGDARADILLLSDNSATGESNISIYPNRSTVDSILVGDRLDFVVDGSPSRFELADVDGDGRVDLVFPNADSNSIQIVLNTSRPGEYSFGRRIRIKVPKSPVQVQVLDFDMDGKPDMAVAYSDGSFAIWRNISAPMPTQVPSAVQLEYPVDGSAVLSDSVYVRWRPATPAVVKYWLESATDSLFVSRFVDSAVTDTGYGLEGLRSGHTYWWKVRAYNAVGWGPFSDVRRFFVRTTDVRLPEGVPTEFALKQNYPNPFNPTTVVRYELPVVSHVRLAVYDLLGREVAVLVNERKASGKYEVRFTARGGSARRVGSSTSGGDGSGLASGIYVYRLTAGDFVQAKKLVLLK